MRQDKGHGEDPEYVGGHSQQQREGYVAAKLLCAQGVIA
jgi:hypothetical protein